MVNVVLILLALVLLGMLGVLIPLALIVVSFVGKRLVPSAQIFTKLAALPGTDLVQAVELPQDVIDYCEAESEDWAVDECKRRARQKYTEDNSDWAVVFTSLQREDGVIK